MNTQALTWSSDPRRALPAGRIPMALIDAGKDIRILREPSVYLVGGKPSM